MTIQELSILLEAKIYSGKGQSDQIIRNAYAGDMLSDVLALGKQPDLLLTGLMNPQVIRTAQMLDTLCVVFLRGKTPDKSVLDLAEEANICVLCTELDMYDACGKLFSNGIFAAR